MLTPLIHTKPGSVSVGKPLYSTLLKASVQLSENGILANDKMTRFANMWDAALNKTNKRLWLSRTTCWWIDSLLLSFPLQPPSTADTAGLYRKNAHRTGLYYEIIIYMLDVICQICLATCWNWFRTRCSPPFYLSGAPRLCTARATHGERPAGKRCAPDNTLSSSDLDVVWQHLTPYLSYTPYAVNAWLGWSEHGDTVFPCSCLQS